MNVNQISTQYSTGTQTRSAKSTASTFGSQLAQVVLERHSMTNVEDPVFRAEDISLSPWSLGAYHKWKAMQEPQNLPASKGWTEENIAYLEERYSGELTPLQQMEAWETLRKMDMITEKQYWEGLGYQFISADVYGENGAFLTYEPLDESTEEIDSMKELCDNVFLPGWLERLREMDRLEEEEQTLKILFAYVDKLVEQMKEENRDKLRTEQLEFWLKRSI